MHPQFTGVLRAVNFVSMSVAEHGAVGTKSDSSNLIIHIGCSLAFIPEYLKETTLSEVWGNEHRIS